MIEHKSGKSWTDIVINNKKYANTKEVAEETGLSKVVIESYLRANNLEGLTTAIIKRRKKIVIPIEGEVWKDIPGYEGRYQVSNMGRVIHLVDGHGNYRPLLVGSDWLSKKDCDYEKIAVYQVVKLPRLPTDPPDKYLQCHQFKIHRLVATLFIPNPNNYPEVNHKNGDGRDNRVENLEWCTSHDNAIHARRVLNRGFSYQSGEQHGNCKLTWEKVNEIRKIYAENLELEYSDIAKLFNISKGQAGEIIRNITWKDDNYIPPKISHYFLKHNIALKRKSIYTKIILPAINKETVQVIREEYAKNNISQIQLAKKYGISRTLVSDIINYKRGYAKI